jgi:hypothetical protein
VRIRPPSFHSVHGIRPCSRAVYYRLQVEYRVALPARWPGALASILIGVGRFGDSLRTGGPSGPLEALSLLIIFAGAFSLAHSPLISGMKGADDQYHELWSQRVRTKRVPDVSHPPFASP